MCSVLTFFNAKEAEALKRTDTDSNAKVLVMREKRLTCPQVANKGVTGISMQTVPAAEHSQ